MYFILFIAIALISAIVSGNFRNKFARYAKIPTQAGLTGREVAEKMLRDNGIFDVRVMESAGYVSDHYDPTQKTVNLSPDVYNGRSISATAAAAHECGHAVQHATAYSWLSLRTALVPLVNMANSASSFIFIAFFFGGFLFRGLMPQLLTIYVIVLAVITAFSLITLPVEIDASSRALAWLKKTNLTAPGEEREYATDALKAAAYTYVIAALGSVAMLLYWVGVLNNDR